MNATLGISVVPLSENAITFDKVKGIILGKDQSAKFILTIFANTDKVTMEEAVSFEFNLELPLEVYL